MKSRQESYISKTTLQHDNFSVVDSGLFLSESQPFIAATPDGLVTCTCCGGGCLEIKCPYCAKIDSVFEAVGRKHFCLQKIDGRIGLPKNQQYYYQVMTQMFVTKRAYCDFYVWTEKDQHCERIKFDDSFTMHWLPKAQSFFTQCLMVEAMGKFYTVPRVTTTMSGSDEKKQGDSIKSTSEIMDCYCERSESGHMIGCDNVNCAYQWFHIKRLNLKSVPKSKTWFCPDCAATKSFQSKKTSKRSKAM